MEAASAGRLVPFFCAYSSRSGHGGAAGVELTLTYDGRFKEFDLKFEPDAVVRPRSASE